MFHELKRKDRALSIEETEDLLKKGTWGVLSLKDENGYPYGVPVNYVYEDGKIFIHGTNKESHKLDCIRQDPRVSFTVVPEYELIREEYTANFSSVILFGEATILEDPEEKKEAILKLMKGLSPEAVNKVEENCVLHTEGYSMIMITPEYISGKKKSAS